ncbi:DUF3556 domain-containing protein [Pseudonocardia bannensis]|uniref:DUF3556 domain-containing protein n=1 Tax=Pseudonocardia bannensis TaxID=630973 RepID=A0A848DLD5_9PSEU|nr:DUF3556 domain-containing protein [Pseudonocardia bannensis]NMH93261.1 DUF3556 domain-containing protein [Pseudonocardia bannensis]
MGFLSADLPEVDLATWKDRPHLERMKVLSRHWVEYGFGTPWAIHVIYVVKIGLYVLGGLFFAATTPGIGSIWDVASWWSEPILFQKALVWTLLFEVLGLGASSGPLAFRFTPPLGGFLYWLRPGTIRLPPWPGRNPLAGGSTRTVFDVLLYAGIIASALTLLLSAGVPKAGAPEGTVGLLDPTLLFVLIGIIAVAGLRDRMLFLASRGEQYWVLCIMFAVLPFVDMIVGAKLLMCVVWWAAATSKLGRHFTFVVCAMTTNAPLVRSKRFRRALYRNYPEDLRPSKRAAVLAHSGTVIEYGVPLVLLFSVNQYVTLGAVAIMAIFHFYITLNFPLAVPLEWNIFYIFATAWLFLGHPAADFGIWSMSSPWLAAGLLVALAFFPVLGNLRPDLVSFLPSMRYYAGNWATTMWAFRRGTGDENGAEHRLNTHVVKSAPNQVDQLTAMYGNEVAELMLQKAVAWRSMHSHGRTLNTLMWNHLDSLENYDIREGEFVAGTLLGWQFGDGHLHDEQFIAAVQQRCGYGPGEVVVVILESQPIHRMRQQYRVVDLALGEIERGSVEVRDMIAHQPWLENGPIPVQVESSAAIGRRSLREPDPA